ncbi:MAG: DegV family protein, partial [Oscillospiraceae bacterium]
MNKFEIYTDCTSDLSPDLVSLMDVKVIPMLYCVNGQEEYFSPGDCNKKSPPFYNALRAGESANTTLINTERYIEIFSPELEAGRDVLYIAFSSGLSGSFNCARIASGILNEKYPDSKLLIVDSLSASLGEGLLVWHTCERRREGISIDDTAKWVEQNATKLCHWFTVDDLNHLKRGGRLSAAAAAVGTVLNIKPVLHVDDEGHLIPISKVRGRTASLDALLDEMGKT